MVIDTKLEASTLRKTKAFVMIVYVVLFVVNIAFFRIEPAVKILICCILSVFFLIFYWYQYNMKYTYFYFSDNNNAYVFKFYLLQFFFGKPQTIEIPKKNFVKYEIITNFFGKRNSLVLYQKTPKGIAKYPPISLTALNKKQKKDLDNSLK